MVFFYFLDILLNLMFFFFSSRRRHTRSKRDWSSDVCSSDLELKGNYFGQFSLSVVIYDLDLGKVDRASAEFYKVFSVHDAQLYEEKYNLLNAFLATIPGNYAWNLRSLYLLNSNYADYSFLFTLDCGEPQN